VIIAFCILLVIDTQFISDWYKILLIRRSLRYKMRLFILDVLNALDCSST